jgi:phosphinothricin acetyltransferase
LNFKDATIDDLQIIVDIYNSTIPSRIVTADLIAVTVESKLDWFKQHNPETRPLWIVEDKDENIIIGWISFQDFYGRPAYNETAEISIYVDEKYRGCGYGKQMLSYAIKQCNNLKIKNLLGFIFEQNITSINLLKAMGFVECGHLDSVAKLDNKYCNLIIMGLRLQSI